MMYYSQLDVLMKTFGLTGRELSFYLHVDSSLISKWKNMKRILPSNSPYVEQIVSHFTSLDKPYGYIRIKKILSEYYPDSDLSSEDKVITYLTKWFIKKESDFSRTEIKSHGNTLGYFTPFEVYEGNAGRRMAVNNLLDFVLKTPQNQHLLLMSQEDMSWLTEDRDFLKTWKEKLAQIVSRNNRITIIHNIDRNSEEIGRILMEWLPLHMSGLIDSWYYPQYGDSLLKATLFIIKGYIAIFGMNIKGCYTSVYKDPVTIEYGEKMFSQYISKCRQFIEPITLKQANKRIDIERNNSIIFSNNLILNSSMMNIIKNDLSIKYMLNIDELGQQDINKGVLKNFIKFLDSHDNFEISIVTQSILKGITLIIIEDTITISFKTNSVNGIYSDEPTVTNAFYQLFIKQWDSIPRIYRSKEWVINKLNQLT